MTSRFVRRARSGGYTLIEMMVVVAIIAILATIAVYGVRKYVLAAKTAEAVEIINGIRAAQESYKDETFGYLQVGDIASYYPYAGKTDLGDKKRGWESGASAERVLWQRLGVRPTSPVQFGYTCLAGTSANTVPSSADLGVSVNLKYPTSALNWYVVRAAADRNKNGVLATFVGSSFTDEIYGENETE